MTPPANYRRHKERVIVSCTEHYGNAAKHDVERASPETENGRRRRTDMKWTVYMLRCRDGSFYTGCTNNLTRRLALHQNGKGAKYTRSRPPVTLAWYEETDGKSEALRREAAVKRLSHAEKVSMTESCNPAALCDILKCQSRVEITEKERGGNPSKDMN